MKLISSILLIMCASGRLFASDAEVGFSPGGSALTLVVKTIDSAKSSVRVAAYTFTSRPVADALARAEKRGVDIRVVVDKINLKAPASAVSFLVSRGIPVRVDHEYAIMHDKFMVVDGSTVEEGSFNYTAAAANKNAENALVLHDGRIAGQYEREWKRLWSESESP